MPTEFSVVIEGELSEETVHAITAAIQKAALLELSDAPETNSADGRAPAPSLIYNRNIRGGRFFIEK